MFDDPRGYMWLIPALPLLGSILICLLGPRLLRGFSHWPCILGAGGACVLSFMLLSYVNSAGENFENIRAPYYTWFEVPAGPDGNAAVNAGFTLRADGLTAIMLVTVTFIGTLIAIYSAGYMHGDP